MRGILALLAVLAPLSGVLLVAAGEKKPAKFTVYVGTYTQAGKSQGVYRMDLDVATGKLSAPTLAGKTVNPSFLALHPTGKYLYACGEISDFEGKKKPTGAINAFAIDDKGDLTFLNAVSSEGAGPCHVVVDKAGKHVFCANYGGGSCAALPIGEDGKVGKATSAIQHKGSSVNKSRQGEPHAHSINLDMDNKYAFVADLGLDQVLVYRFDADKGTLTANDPAFVKVDAGAGPRHFAFHPTGKYAYVINEIANTITAMTYDAKAGKLEPIQTITTLPEGHKGTTHTAEVVVHPSGRFVYGSNRGHNSIAVFEVDEKTGKLTAAGHQGKDIKTPRNFAIDPTGAWCLVANQDGNTVLVFRVDPETGALLPTDQVAEIASPVCVRFLARGK